METFRSRIVQALSVSLTIYCVAVLTTMAGMEIFGWLSALLVLTLVSVDLVQKNKIPFQFIWWGHGTLAGLFIVVVLAALINRIPEGAPVYEILGRVRWIVLFTLLAMGFHYTYRQGSAYPEKFFKFLMIVATVIGVYAIFQHFTGIDLIRNSNRAVQLYGSRPDGSQFWRAAGMFSAPLTYGYAFAMVLCFPLAFMMVPLEKGKRRLFWTVSTIIIFLSLVATFTRGVWLAAFVGICAVCLSFHRKVGLLMMGVMIVGVAVLMKVDPVVHSRMMTMFNAGYTSNSERIELWYANFEMFKDYPLIGVGFGENAIRVNEYIDKLGLQGAFRGGHAHNTYFQMLAGTGALGFLFYMAFIGFFIYAGYRLWKLIPLENVWHRAFALASVGAQLSLHVGGLTECNFQDAEVNHPFILMLAFLAFLWQHYRLGPYSASNGWPQQKPSP